MRTAHPVIIKKKSRRGGDESGGGGAWKVAFADFMIALMALFLVLWILAASSKEELEDMSTKLREYSVFEGQPNPFELGNSQFPLDLEGYPSIIEGVAAELLTSGNQGSGSSMHNQQVPDGDKASGTGGGPSLDTIFDSGFTSRGSLNLLKDVLEEMGRQMGALDNLAVEIVPQGLRIRLQDNDDRQMFRRGGIVMDPFFEDMLLSIAPVFTRIENKLIISGHTDAVPFVGTGYSNWELSGERAMLARRALEIGGAPHDRILQVAGMSDRSLARPEDPTGSGNRRIEILVLTEDAENELMGLFDSESQNSAVEKARDDARRNMPVTR